MVLYKRSFLGFWEPFFRVTEENSEYKIDISMKANSYIYTRGGEIRVGSGTCGSNLESLRTNPGRRSQILPDNGHTRS